MRQHQTNQPTEPNPRHALAALVLAAGESRRMGEMGAKQLLAWWGGRTMLQVVIDQLVAANLPLSEVIVVLGSGAGAIVPTLSKEQWPDLPLRVVVNENWAAGMLGSVQRGLSIAGVADGYLILLGDQPEIAPATIADVTAAYFGAGAMRPTLPIVGGVEGHPLVIPLSVRDKVLAAVVDTPGGLRALIGDEVLRVEVADRATLWDIDTPADYASRR